MLSLVEERCSIGSVISWIDSAFRFLVEPDDVNDDIVIHDLTLDSPIAQESSMENHGQVSSFTDADALARSSRHCEEICDRHMSGTSHDSMNKLPTSSSGLNISCVSSSFDSRTQHGRIYHHSEVFSSSTKGSSRKVAVFGGRLDEKYARSTEL